MAKISKNGGPSVKGSYEGPDWDKVVTVGMLVEFMLTVGHNMGVNGPGGPDGWPLPEGFWKGKKDF